ncbi:MAG: hypothetical protein Q4D11_03675 [Rhodospirillales bacterium]|nr:hypothetical protein [Rhodospirillales bacterium]
MAEIKFNNIIMIMSVIATILCVLGMIAIFDACSFKHIVFMVLNMIFIAVSWINTIKENKEQVSL